MKKNIAFSICSNNYLAQVCALKDSFLNYNKDYIFYVILVDEFSEEVDYELLKPAKIVLASEIDHYNFQELLSRYNIIELNTAIKASVFKYLIENTKDCGNIFYLDPDLFFYNSLKEAEDILDNGKSMVLTPHILSPIPRDSKAPDENIFLNFGIYNLGFLGLNAQNTETQEMLDWWEERTLFYGYIDIGRGYFVDQLWMNLAPIYFKGASVIKSYGYNVAPWNLHERTFNIKEDKKYVNGQDLVFYHFSKLSSNQDEVSRVYNRYSLDDKPQLRTLYKEYREKLEHYNYESYKGLKIAYQLKEVGSPKKVSDYKKITKKVNMLLSRIFSTKER